MPKETPEKLDLRSMDITDEKKQQLKQLFPEVFREDEVDFDHLKRVLGEWVDPGKERFGLQWPGKAECMKTIQQPSIATLRPDRQESVNFDETEHLFIEGDNLEVLKLLQKSYFGKVKMIYIDPPYNTGKEFIYPDNYTESLDTYLKYTGQKDAEGNWQSSNKETEGRYHSKWLNMMYSRLFLAKNLLKEDGVIFISISDHEVAHLRKILDELFGEENFEGHIHWRRRFNQPNDPTKMIGLVAEHILAYAKNSKVLKEKGVGKLDVTGSFSNPDDDPRGDWASKPWKVGSNQSGSRYKITTPTGKVYDEEWMGEEKTFKSLLEDNRIVFTDGGNGLPRKKYYKFERQEEGQSANNWWDCDQFGHNQGASSYLGDLFKIKNVFDNPKPIELLRSLIQIGNVQENDIVLDFFAGSSSTADALYRLNYEDGENRKFIMVQLPERIDPDNNEHKEAVEFCNKNNLNLKLTEPSKERIRRVIQQINEHQKQDKQLELGEDSNTESKQDLGFKVFKLTPSNFKVWEAPDMDIEPEKLKEQLDAFSDHLNPENEEESTLFELILKSGFPLTANVEKIELDGKNVFNVENGKLMICLAEELTFEVLDAISEKEPQRVICLDNGFTDDNADALKTNAVQLFKSKEIEFRTV